MFVIKQNLLAEQEEVEEGVQDRGSLDDDGNRSQILEADTRQWLVMTPLKLPQRRTRRQIGKRSQPHEARRRSGQGTGCRLLSLMRFRLCWQSMAPCSMISGG